MQCLITFQNSSNFVGITLLHVVVSTLFSVFGNAVKHGLLCVIYYIIPCVHSGPISFKIMEKAQQFRAERVSVTTFVLEAIKTDSA